MGKILWDQVGEKKYETGVSNGVLYPIDDTNKYSHGYAWNGLSSVNENPSGAEETKVFADNIKYLSLLSAEEYAATVEAYIYPDEFEECDGSKEIAPGVTVGQQDRKTFGLVYKTILGNDAQGNNYGYKLHLIYGCKATPSQRSYGTINESPEANAFSWEIKTTAVPVDGYKATASVVIDSTKIAPEKLAQIEAMLFGVDADLEKEIAEVIPHLPMPNEIIAIMKAAG